MNFVGLCTLFRLKMGCAKSESVFSMGTAATCPFIMSEQSPRSIKLRQYMHEVTNRHYDKLKFLKILFMCCHNSI